MNNENIKNETALGGFPPTEEQLLIKDHYIKGDNVMVDAGAGSSKTSSGIYITEQDNRSVLYLAYNKAIAQEATSRFPSNVTIKTFHALAYAFVGHKYRDKLSRPTGKYVNVAMTISEIQKYYNIQPIEGCNALRISSLIKDTITKFEYSADEKITSKHVSKGKLEEFQRLSQLEKSLDFKKLTDIAVAYAQRLWDDRTNLQSQVLCSHDTYLKLFQLSGPKLNYDCIIGDEFQDVNPVVADIILNQTCQRVLIGDPNQSIYGWRGAQNFLKDSEDYTTLLLSKSFRYGQAIADLAMTVINYKRKLEGFDQKDSVIGIVDKTKPYTKIFRTNACLLLEAVDLIAEGVAVVLDDKINLTINGKTMDGISPEGVDMPELREDKIDYSKYKNLTEFFIHGLIDFSTFISRDVPAKFKKKDTDKQELHSSQQGVKAYKTCIGLLENELKTGESGYVEPEDFNHLHQWYVNGIIDFMGITMSDIPEQLMFNNAMLLYDLMEPNKAYKLKQLCVIWGKDRTRIYMNLLVSHLKVKKISYRLENNNTKAFKFVKIIKEIG